jgi:APA family basic amino acid/polyamine antiporter
MSATDTEKGAPKVRQKEDLRRSITGRLLFFYVLGDVLGSGIYALIGIMALQVGGAFWTSFVIGVTVAMLTGFAYAEMITKYPQAAGAALYVSKAFGLRSLTFVVTFFMLSASIAAAGALALVFGGGYFKEFIDLPTTSVAVGFIVVLALLNFRGISESVKANMMMSLVEITGLGIILAVGAAVVFQGNADFSRPFEFKGDSNEMLLVLAGAALAFFSMTGFENAANVAEETKNPNKVFPRALLGGMAVAGVLYLLVAFIASMVAPTDEIAGSESALLEVVKAGPIPIPPSVFAAIALVAVTNTALVALVAQSRIMYGMAREGVVPRVFARTHASRQTPWVAIVFTTAIVIGLLLTADVERLAAVTVLFLIAVYAMVCVSALKLRKDKVDHDHYRAPTFILWAGLVANIGLLVNTVIDDPGSVGYSGIMLAVGLGLYLINNFVTPKADRRVIVEESEEETVHAG